MDTLVTFFIFVVVLFMYIHIMSQFKRSEELEIYETDFTTGAHLNDVCEIKQPVLFNIKHVTPTLFQDITPQVIARFSSHDIKLKDTRDYYKKDEGAPVSVDSIYLPLNTTVKLLETDTESHLFSENNNDFLDESGLLKKIQHLDGILKPSMTLSSHCDLMFGSCNTVTPLRYHTDSRKFLCVTSGKIRVKMTPWKSSKYLHPYKDFENYEFRSMVHPICPDPEFASDFEKTNFIEFDVNEGYLLYVPAYWWYSIVYLDDPSTFVCSVTYNTFTNHLSNLPDLSMYFLQQQNITKKVVSNTTNLTIPSNHDTEEEPIVEDIQIKSGPVEEVCPDDISATVIEETTESDKNTMNEQDVDTDEKENISYSVSNI